MTKAPVAKNRFLLGVIIAGSLLRLIEPIFLNPLDKLYSDPWRHWSNGFYLFSRNNLTIDSDPLGFQLFVHYLQIATNQNRIAIGIIFGLISVAFPWLWYRAARELHMPKQNALLFYAIVIWMPSLLTIFSFMMSEVLLLPMTGLSLWMSARHLRKGTLGSYLVAVGLWTLTCQVKTIVLPVAAVACLYGWVVKSRQFSSLAWAGLVFGLILLPNTIRTYHLMGYAAPFGSSWAPRLQLENGARGTKFDWGKDHYFFSSPSMYVAPLWPLSLWGSSRNITNQTYKITIDPTKGQADWRLAESRIEYTWSRRLNDHVENAIFLLFGPSWPDSGFNSLEGLINYWNRWLWCPLIFVVLACNLDAFGRRKWELIPILTTVLFLFLLLQNEAIMEGRYRKALEVLILLNLIWFQKADISNSNEANDI